MGGESDPAVEVRTATRRAVLKKLKVRRAVLRRQARALVTIRPAAPERAGAAGAGARDSAGARFARQQRRAGHRRPAQPPRTSRRGTVRRNVPLAERTAIAATVRNSPPSAAFCSSTRAGDAGPRRPHLPVHTQPPGPLARDPQRQPVGVVGRLGDAVPGAQARLEARDHRVIEELVLPDRPDARVAVGDPVGLVDVLRLAGGGDAEQSVGRVGLEPVLGVVDREVGRNPAVPRTRIEDSS